MTLDLLLSIAASNALFATGLALVAAVISARHRSPQLARILWLLVLAKLLTPPLVPVPVPSAEPSAAGAFEPAPSEPALARSSVEPTLFAERGDVVSESGATVHESVAHTASALRRSGRWVPLLAGLWAMGAIGIACLTWIRSRRLNRVVVAAAPAPSSIESLMRRTAHDVGLKDVPEVRFISARVSPFLWTRGRPATVVLPAGLIDEISRCELRAIIAHELIHLKRRDHWVRRLEVCVLTVYWWLPVAWWARRRIHYHTELCCDADVVQRFPDQTRDYARALVEATAFARPTLVAAVSLLGNDARTLERRVSMVLSPRAPLARRAYLVLLIALLGAAPWGLPGSDVSTVFAGPCDPVDDLTDLKQTLEQLRATTQKLEKLIASLERGGGQGAVTSRSFEIVESDTGSKPHRIFKGSGQPVNLAAIFDVMSNESDAALPKGTLNLLGDGCATGARVEVDSDGAVTIVGQNGLPETYSFSPGHERSAVGPTLDVDSHGTIIIVGPDGKPHRHSFGQTRRHVGSSGSGMSDDGFLGKVIVVGPDGKPHSHSFGFGSHAGGDDKGLDVDAHGTITITGPDGKTHTQSFGSGGGMDLRELHAIIERLHPGGGDTECDEHDSQRVIELLHGEHDTPARGRVFGFGSAAGHESIKAEDIDVDLEQQLEGVDVDIDAVLKLYLDQKLKSGGKSSGIWKRLEHSGEGAKERVETHVETDSKDKPGSRSAGTWLELVPQIQASRKGGGATLRVQLLEKGSDPKKLSAEKLHRVKF